MLTSIQYVEANDSHDAEHSDRMQHGIIALKDATGQASVLQGQDLIVLVLPRNVSKPRLQRHACSRPAVFTSCLGTRHSTVHYTTCNAAQQLTTVRRHLQALERRRMTCARCIQQTAEASGQVQRGCQDCKNVELMCVRAYGRTL